MDVIEIEDNVPKKRIVIKGKGNPNNPKSEFGEKLVRVMDCAEKIGKITETRIGSQWLSKSPEGAWKVFAELPSVTDVSACGLNMKENVESAPIGLFAQVEHRGGYENIGESYQKLGKYAGFRINGAMEEIYMTKPQMMLPKGEMALTLIRVPIRKKIF